jgi:hypothetical protein
MSKNKRLELPVLIDMSNARESLLAEEGKQRGKYNLKL